MVLYELLRLSLLLAALIPAAFVVAAIFVRKRAPFAAARVVTSATVSLAIGAVTLHGVLAGLGFTPDRPMLRGWVQLDIVSSAMLLLVCTLATVVVRYSQTYLAGEGGLVRYARSLVLTLAAVTILVISNHLGLLVAAWLATGIGLHQLLTFYRRRRQAVIVAHKEFLLSRLADLGFAGSIFLVENEVGSLHIDVVNAYAQAHKGLSPSLHLATVLLVFAVLLKTAQAPFHGWILQVMEAPTPVSALLHAGVVNIGGFVMIRLAPLMSRATVAQGILINVGLFTAIIASLIMTTRSSIKVSLAWSTIAQMGFMLVQCGLCVWHLALLHLLAHSLYKANAFLSAGSVVDTWRGASLVRQPSPSPRNLLTGAGILFAAAAPLWIAFTLSPLHAPPGLGALTLALVLSFVPTMGRAVAAGRKVLKLTALSIVGATVLYYVLHAMFEEVAPSIGGAATSMKWSLVGSGLVVLFVAQTILQTNPTGAFARWLQPHLRSGLYIDDWFTRLTFRMWPPRVERPQTSRRSSVTLEVR